MFLTRAVLLFAALLATAAHAEGLSPPPLAEAQGEPAALPRPLQLVRGVERFEYMGEPVVGFHLQSAVRKDLLIPGSVLFGLGWLLTGIAGISVNSLAFVPFVGAFVLAAQTATGSVRGGFLSTAGAFGVGLFVITAVVQLAGAGLLVLAAALPQRWLERDLGDVHVALVPSIAGANLVGSF